MDGEKYIHIYQSESGFILFIYLFNFIFLVLFLIG